MKLQNMLPRSVIGMPEEEPPECDVADFSFKHLVKVQLGPTPETEVNQRCHLLAISNKYGLTFVGCANGVKVLRTDDLRKKGMEGNGVGDTVTDFPVWVIVDTVSPPCHLALSSDDLTLSVCITRPAGVFALMFDIRAFARQGLSVAPFVEVRLSMDSEVRLSDLMWNPGEPFVSLFASCMSDGSVALWEVKESVTVTAKLPPTVQGTCLCWSPKGKQLVVGKRDGALSQYDQQLKEKKNIPAHSDRFSVVDVFWESTHVFVAAYTAKEAEQPFLFTVHVPKGVGPSYRNYEDVCFGGGQDRKHKYYLDVIPQWNMILAASSNALEAAVLGRSQQDPGMWERWNLEDSGRSELPLTDNCEETYPMGAAVDFTSQTPIPHGENELHPPAPLLMLLSTDGVLVTFHMLYTRPGIPQLTRPATDLTPGGERTAKTSSFPAAPAEAPPAAVTVVPSVASLEKPPATLTLGEMSATAPMGSLSFVTPVSTVVTEAVSTSLTFGGTPVSGQNMFGFKPLGGATSLGSGITSQKGQLAQPIFGSNNQFNQSNNLFNQSGNDSTSMTSADASLSTVLASTSHTQGGTTGAATKTGLGFGGQLPGGSGGQLAGMVSADLTAKSQSSGVVQPDGQTSASIPKPVTMSLSTRLPKTNDTTSDNGIASTRSDTRTFDMTQGAQASGGDTSLTITQQVDTDSVENLLKTSIIEEMQHFQTEMAELRARGAAVRVDIGSREEVQHIKRSTQEMTTFCDDIRQTTQGISEEIDELRTRCLDSFAMFEECRMRDLRNQSPDYKRLLRGRGLDPISNRRFKDIRMLYSTLQTKIRDVDLTLDAEWEMYKRKRNVGRLLKTPASDNIYHTIGNNQRVIASQLRTLTRLSVRAKDVYLGRGRLTLPSFVKPQPLDSLQADNISQLIERFTQTRLASISVVPAAVSPAKTSQLKQLLAGRAVTSVKSTTPKNLSMSLLVNSSALRELNTSTQVNQTTFDDSVMTQTCLVSSDVTHMSTGLSSLSTGTGKVTEPIRPMIHLNTIPQFDNNNSGVSVSGQGMFGLQNNRVRPRFSATEQQMSADRNAGLDLTRLSSPQLSVHNTSLGGVNMSQTTFGKSQPTSQPDSSAFAATFGKSLPTSQPDSSGFAATFGKSQPTSQPDSSGFVATFGKSQPTSQPDSSGFVATFGKSQPTSQPDSSGFAATFGKRQPTSQPDSSGFAATFGKSQPTSQPDSSRFAATFGMSQPTSQPDSSGFAATFGMSQPTSQPDSSRFAATFGMSQPTSQPDSSGFAATFGKSLPTDMSQPAVPDASGLTSTFGSSQPSDTSLSAAGVPSGFAATFGKSLQDNTSTTGDKTEQAGSRPDQARTREHAGARTQEHARARTQEHTGTRTQEHAGARTQEQQETQGTSLTPGGFDKLPGSSDQSVATDARPEAEEVEPPQKPAMPEVEKVEPPQKPARPEVEKVEPPQKPAAFSFSSASRELSFGSDPPKQAVAVGHGPPEPEVTVECGPPESEVTVECGPPESAPNSVTLISGVESTKPLFSFSTETGPKAFAISTPVANLFGGGTNSTTEGTPSLFGGSTATPPSSTGGAPSLFGDSTATPPSSTWGAPSLFGGSVATPPSSTGGVPSMFGGGIAAPTTAAPSVFGGGASITSVAGSPLTPQKEECQVQNLSMKQLGESGVLHPGGMEEGGNGKPVEKAVNEKTKLLSAMLGADDEEDETPARVGTAAERAVEKLPPVTSSLASIASARPSTAATVFGQATTTQAVTSSGLFGQTSGSQFSFGGQSKTNPPLFGASTAKPIFGAGPVSESVSQTGPSPTATAKSATVTTPTPTALFGGISTTTTAPLFGTTSTTTTPSIFGGITTATTVPSIFGGDTTAATVPSIFGGVSSATTAPSIFGGVSTATTAPLFGVATTTTTTAGPSMFGGVNTTTTTPLFGGGAMATTTPAFGSITTTTTTTLFGGSATTSTSVFGGLAVQTTGSVFGGQASAVPSSGGTSIFGQQGSVFGQPTTTSTSVFGGQPATTASMFGEHQAAPLFGTSATFGQTSTSAAFGQSTPGGPFGQTSTSGGVFGSGGGGGGGLFGGLGGKPSAENANKNVFGVTQTFGPNQQTSSLFGGQTSDKFNTVKTTAGFGSSFGEGATGSVMSSGFGFQSPPTATASPGVSSQAVFGGGGVFGGAPTFGSPSGFGNTSFSSPFGGGLAAASPPGGGMFGSTQTSAQTTGGFAGFATNSQSPTFGSLAHNTPQQPTFGGSGFGDAPAPSFGGGGSFGFSSPSSAAPSFTAYRN